MTSRAETLLSASAPPQRLVERTRPCKRRCARDYDVDRHLRRGRPHAQVGSVRRGQGSLNGRSPRRIRPGAFAAWQACCRPPLPDEPLHSNPDPAAVQQTIDLVPRMRTPFPESAAVGNYRRGVAFCCLWLRARGYQITWLALSIASALPLTTTTKIVMPPIGLPRVLVIGSGGGDRRALAWTGRTVNALLLRGPLALGRSFVRKPAMIDTANDVHLLGKPPGEGTLSFVGAQVRMRTIRSVSDWMRGAVPTVFLTRSGHP